MRLAPLAILILAPSALADGLPAELRACERDEQCAVLDDPCGAAAAVAREKLEAARALLPKRECHGAKREATALCRHGSCTLSTALEDPTGHAYDLPAETYARRFDDPKRDRWQKPRHVVELLELRPGMTVVDLGAGTGYFEPHLDRAVGEGGRVIALDVTTTFTKYLEQRARRERWKRVSVLLAERDDPRLAPASVDRVLIVDTWHHIGEREAYARKLAAALRPGGRVVVVDYTLDSPEGPDARHRMDPQIPLRELASAGLTAELVAEKLPRQYVVVARKAP